MRCCERTVRRYTIEKLRPPWGAKHSRYDLRSCPCRFGATSFFTPVSIGPRQFVDGALGANNPVDEVEGEASAIWCSETGDLKPLVKCFASIGIGNSGQKLTEDNMMKFVSKTLEALTAETEKTAGSFVSRWRNYFNKDRYFRLNVQEGLQDVGLAKYQEQGLTKAATYVLN